MRPLIVGLVLALMSAAAQPQEFGELVRKAEQGDAFAQKELGDVYKARGELAEAFYWYRIGAFNGNARAQLELANAYQHGHGIRRSLMLAHLWYTVAAVICGKDETSDEFLLSGWVTETNRYESMQAGAAILHLMIVSGRERSCLEYDRWAE